MMPDTVIHLLEKQGNEVIACDHIRDDHAPLDLKLSIGKKRILLLCAGCGSPIEASLLRSIFEKAVASVVAEKMTLR